MSINYCSNGSVVFFVKCQLLINMKKKDCSGDVKLKSGTEPDDEVRLLR